MSDPVAQYIIKARDDASSVLVGISGAVTDLRDAMSTLATKAGPVGAVGVALTGLAAAAAAGAKSLADSAEQLGRLSEISGVSVDKLQVMQQVLSEAGVDSEGITTALVKLNRAIVNGDPLLARLGITAKDPLQAFMQLSEVISNTADVKVRDEVATRLLGKSGAEMIPAMTALASGFSSAYDQFQRYGVLLKGPVLESVNELDSQMDAFSRNWALAMTRMKEATIGPLNEIVGAFNDLSDAADGSEQAQLRSYKRWLAGAETKIRELIADENRHGSGIHSSELASYFKSAEHWRDLIAEIEHRNRGLERSRSLHETQATTSSGGGATAGDLNGSTGDPTLHMPARESNNQGAVYNDHTKTRVGMDELGIRQAVADASVAMENLKNDFADGAEAERQVSAATKFMVENLSSGAMQLQSDMKGITTDVLTGTISIGTAWSRLIDSIMNDLASSAASFGVDLLFSFIPIPGAGAVGDKVGNMGKMTAQGAGGSTTYNINALDSKSVVQELTSPTGSMRRANDYVRAVSRAATR